ncbi:hypothetical protein DAMA08_042750 [Martiniozyma asiatica (nom. inval.)]|nr:hypothetical protein DAMA08_027060 [Martiniozyma asiatica]GMM31530.1 hypothetical protein DAMA08_042750 [Martiniozyma asiatica]
MIEFPESVLQEQEATSKGLLNKSNIPINNNNNNNASNSSNVSEKQRLSITSSLYTPQDPFSIPTKSAEIESRLASIQNRFARLQEKEELRQRQLLRKNFEKYVSTPKLSDFKRQTVSLLLLASAVCISCHATWWWLAKEEKLRQWQSLEVEKKDTLERILQNQGELFDINKSSKWFSWLW